MHLISHISHTQEELNAMQIDESKMYQIEYINKDYFNGEETIEKSEATIVRHEGKIYFNVIDPYGMEKMIMNARIIG